MNTTMTAEERRRLRKWIADGNDAADNPWLMWLLRSSSADLPRRRLVLDSMLRPWHYRKPNRQSRSSQVRRDAM